MKTQLPKVVLVVVSALLARSAAASPAAGQAPQGLAASSRTLCGAQDEGELRVSDVVEAVAHLFDEHFLVQESKGLISPPRRPRGGRRTTSQSRSPCPRRGPGCRTPRPFALLRRQKYARKAYDLQIRKF